mmetsp:Transcript_2087/g.2357  ORF Transcript_2087/g.2357 Transcript_2087/m.2357 type:complete len:151 (+) Transcript_2087:217-669(+)|eukprot:CAMPEP_0205804142 /NCGR_PEP_ID=MMETSP0205-20121125/6946_1 /ASSEMBLY_ACC=CAM_ASM_000278 /TAXON_ID=36767 /ORGANISM="Euplotes focardii, Strain TN1" /LENGTH=150 /DNA_ID=CAMNT_0053073225 /DNA_START=209 /DNA_END=661 /DNA_ORIENTATION=-
MFSDSAKSIGRKMSGPREKKRKYNLPDLSKNLDKIMEMVTNCQGVTFEATTKSSRGLHNGKSNRRSQFIGVLRNGKRWQVLINVGKKKKYIGTYAEEKEAAVVHDFYSIGLNGLNAKTNFTLDQTIVGDMITSFSRNEEVFHPLQFIDRV